MVVAKRLGVRWQRGKRSLASATPLWSIPSLLPKVRDSLAAFLLLASSSFAQDQSAYYRTETYELPIGVNFEASGIAVLPDGKLAVGLRKGEVWIAQNPTDTAKPDFKLFASGLHEILGLAWHDGALYATQRSEVTKLRDTDADSKADEYLSASTGFICAARLAG